MAAQNYAIDLAATVLTDVSAGGVVAGTYLLNICNRTTAKRKVRIAVTTGANPTNAQYIEYDAVVEANGVLSRHPLALGAGWKVFAYADGTGLSIGLNGETY